MLTANPDHIKLLHPYGSPSSTRAHVEGRPPAASLDAYVSFRLLVHQLLMMDQEPLIGMRRHVGEVVLAVP